MIFEVWHEDDDREWSTQVEAETAGAAVEKYARDRDEDHSLIDGCQSFYAAIPGEPETKYDVSASVSISYWVEVAEQ